MKNYQAIVLVMMWLLIPWTGGQAQRVSKKQIEEKVKSIQQDPDYISAMGSGATYEEADKNALSALSSQIIVNVSSDISMQTSVTEGDGNFSKEDVVKSKIETYSITTLPNVKQVVLGGEPDFQVLRYMRVEEVAQIFKARETKILNYAAMGKVQEDRLQIADALRYYNWALILLKSYPYEEKVCIDAGGQKMPAKPWLDTRINELLNGIKVSVIDVSENENSEYPYTLLLDVSYNGTSVSNLDYYYHNGYSYIGPVSAKDGRGMADFDDYPQSGFIFRCEYTFRGQAENLDSELRSVMSHIVSQPFPAATKNVSLDKSSKKLHKEAVKQEEKAESAPLLTTNAADVVAVVNASELAEIERIEDDIATEADREERLTATMYEIEKAIRAKKYASVKSYFTEDGYDMFEKLIAYGNATVMGVPHYRFLEMKDVTVCRSLPIQFRFSGNREFLENVTFRFTNDNDKISSLAFTLNKIAENDILKMKTWDEQSRMILISFLEDYQTAYALKRLDYIESIFSEDAWIITGTVLKKAHLSPEQQIHFDAKDIKYITYTKQEYVDKLRISFASKEFINLRFEDNQVIKDARGQEIYAIQIKQDYYSNNYGDTGYLTLLVDLRGELPIIHIRVWQEKKDEEFSASHFLKTLQ